MSNVIPFAQAPVPAYVSAFFTPEDSNVTAKQTIPGLSFRGKNFRISLDGEETLITNREGDPVTTIPVVVLDQVPNRSRVFYEGQYTAGDNKPPRCSSVDGVRPDASISEPVCSTCAKCPNAVKGSKITAANKQTTACVPVKRIVLVPAGKLDFAALLARIPQTSMWDKNNQENEAKGWYAWDQYLDFLKSRGVTHLAQVVTKIKFDARMEYPKLLFSADRWLTQEELAVVQARWKSDEVGDLLYGRNLAPATYDEDAEDGMNTAQQAPAQQAPAQQAPAQDAPNRPRRTRTQQAESPQAPAQQAPAQQAPAQQSSATAAAFGSMDDAEAPDQQAPAQQAPAQQAPAQQAPATSNSGMSSLLSGWDD